jgi:hypothetical protein
MIAKSGSVVYVTQCNLVEKLLQTSVNFTEKIPVTQRNSSIFVDPISYVIKMAASPTRCKDIASSRWNNAGQRYCMSPAFKECVPPRDPPVEAA